METLTTTTTTTLTTNEAAAAGAVFGGMLGMIGALSVAFFILMIVAMWKIFTKAGEKGWKAIIPIYNIYIFFKIADAKGWFWGILISEIVVAIYSTIASGNGAITTNAYGNVTSISDPFYAIVVFAAAVFQIVAYIIQSAKLSKAFKRGFGTTLGLIFLPNIFQLILAFGSAKYDKKTLK